MTDQGDGENVKTKPPETFKIRIDKTDFEINNSQPTGRDLLLLAGKNPPERFQIFQRQNSGTLVQLPLDKTVDLTEPGVERFVTLPLDQTEGETATPLRNFRLSETDTETLDSLGLTWETIREGDIAAVVIRKYPIPAGYNCTEADLHIRLGPGYPDTQIDMAYVHPALIRVDGREIRNMSEVTFAGVKWQQWSRHRTAENPWRPGLDDIGTHLALVNHWFTREFVRLAA
ncbi:MAG TPA: multiubiquitin domain-containing protein [Xanthobacteraceae bacterium]|jgi:hypothetical protein|nr:multiubiquitin domain-containing protein [Xanthobacteraceae bacterium]